MGTQTAPVGQLLGPRNFPGGAAGLLYATKGDGTNDYSRWSAGLGISDGPSGTFAAHIKMNGGDGVQQRIFSQQTVVGAGNSRLSVIRLADNTIDFRLRNSSNQDRVHLRTTWTLTTADGWTSAMFDWTTGGTINAYKDDTAGATVLVNTSGDVDYSQSFWSVFAATDGSAPLNACLSSVIFDDSRVGFETESVRRRFYDPGIGAMSPGEDGSDLMGMAARVALTNPYNLFHINNGIGPNGTVFGGPFVACETTP